jgi:hypothetical protein
MNSDFSQSFIKSTHTFEEIRLEVHIKEISTQALHRVIERENMDALAILDIKTLMYVDEVAKFHSQVVTSDFVHLDSTFLHVIGAQADKDGISPFLASVSISVDERVLMRENRRDNNRTMIVSPRKRERTSIVAGLRVATVELSSILRPVEKPATLTRVVV